MSGAIMDDVNTKPAKSADSESRSMLKFAQDQLQAAKKYQDDNKRQELWKRLEKKMRGQYFPDQNKRKVETIASYVYETINTVAPRKPYIRVSAKSPKYITENGIEVDNVRNARFREGAINQVLGEIKVHRQVKKGMRDAFCPYGYGVYKIGYQAQTMFDERGLEHVAQEGLWVKWHPSQDFFAGVFSTDQDDMPCCFWRIWMPKKKALQTGEQRGWNMDVINKLHGVSVPKFLYSDQRKDYSADVEMLELYEMHNIEEDWLATFCKDGEDFLEMPKDNPYLFKGMHGCIYAPWPLNSEFYPRSQADLIEGQADDINESREFVRSHIKAFPFLVVDYSDDPTKNDFDWAHAPYGAKINMKNGKPGDIQVFPAPPLNRDVYMWGDQARSDSQWVLAKSDMSHGSAGDSSESATKTSVVAGKENVNIAGMQDEVADVYERLADKCGDLLVQYTTEPKWFRYQGEVQGDQKAPFEEYTFMDIIGDFDHKVDVETLSQSNNEVRSQTIMNLVAQSLDPKMGQVGVELNHDYKMTDALKKAYKMLNVDLEEYRRPPESNPTANDPYQENQAAMDGCLLDKPLPGEEWHIPVHLAVAMATKNEEISRHIIRHRETVANTPEGTQMYQQTQQQMGGMVQPKPQPTMGGQPQPPGGAVLPAATPPGVGAQINPMVR